MLVRVRRALLRRSATLGTQPPVFRLRTPTPRRVPSNDGRFDSVFREFDITSPARTTTTPAHVSPPRFASVAFFSTSPFVLTPPLTLHPNPFPCRVPISFPHPHPCANPFLPFFYYPTPLLLTHHLVPHSPFITPSQPLFFRLGSETISSTSVPGPSR